MSCEWQRTVNFSDHIQIESDYRAWFLAYSSTGSTGVMLIASEGSALITLGERT